MSNVVKFDRALENEDPLFKLPEPPKLPTGVLYNMVCVPMKGKAMAIKQPYTLIIVADTSAEATRKAVKFLNEISVGQGVDRVEILKFERATDPAETLVIV